MNREIEQFVTVCVADEHFGIPIERVFEIIFVPTITRIAKAPPSMVGVINIRGQVIPVIDLRLVFDRPAVSVTKRQRIVVTQSREKILGLLVDEVTEVLRIRTTDMEAVPGFMKTAFTNYIDSVCKVDDRIIILLNMDQLIDPIELMEYADTLENMKP